MHYALPSQLNSQYTTMGTSTNIYLFGDQTIRVQGHLQGLLYVADNGILTSFLEKAFLAIQQEISRLPAAERDAFPQTETLGLLLDSINRNGKHHAALESALVCIYELGYYIK